MGRMNCGTRIWWGRGRGGAVGWGAALGLTLVLFGAGRAVADAPLVEALKQRVTAFWEARIQGDEVSAYQYEIYAYTGALTLTQYIQARSPTLKYMDYTIDNIQEQEKEARVTVSIECRTSIPGIVADIPLDSVITEHWTRLDDGQWYRKSRKNKERKPNRIAPSEG